MPYVKGSFSTGFKLTKHTITVDESSWFRRVLVRLRLAKPKLREVPLSEYYAPLLKKSV
jgi:hypothetical protein